MSKVPKYEYATVVTVCSSRSAELLTIDTDLLKQYDLIFEDKSLVSTLGMGDDSQVTLYSHDDAEGATKTFIGTPHQDDYARLIALEQNKYEKSDIVVAEHVYSVNFQVDPT